MRRFRRARLHFATLMIATAAFGLPHAVATDSATADRGSTVALPLDAPFKASVGLAAGISQMLPAAQAEQAIAAIDATLPARVEWQTIANGLLERVDEVLGQPDATTVRYVASDAGRLLVADVDRSRTLATVWIAPNAADPAKLTKIADGAVHLQGGMAEYVVNSPGVSPVTGRVSLGASSSSDPICEAPDCIGTQVLVNAITSPICLAVGRLGLAAACSAATQFAAGALVYGCDDVKRLCFQKDATALFRILNVSCANYYTCSFSGTATEASRLNHVDGYYFFHIAGYIAYEIESIHSGVREYRRLATTPTGYQMWEVNSTLYGDATSRRYRCSMMVTIDAYAAFDNGRRPQASYTRNKNTGGRQSDCYYQTP